MEAWESSDPQEQMVIDALKGDPGTWRYIDNHIAPYNMRADRRARKRAWEASYRTLALVYLWRAKAASFRLGWYAPANRWLRLLVSLPAALLPKTVLTGGGYRWRQASPGHLCQAKRRLLFLGLDRKPVYYVPGEGWTSE